MDRKKAIRTEIFQRRKKISEEFVIYNSQIICDKICELEEFKKSSCIYTYVDFKKEVMTRGILRKAWEMRKKTAVPKVQEDGLVFYIIDSFEQLKKGYFGIEEPVSGKLADDEHAFMVVPGVAFDKQLHRIGYGKGFYDRYLSNHPKHPTAAVAFDFQIMQEIPCDQYDIRPDQLVTETMLLKV